MASRERPRCHSQTSQTGEGNRRTTGAVGVNAAVLADAHGLAIGPRSQLHDPPGWQRWPCKYVSAQQHHQPQMKGGGLQD